MPARYVVVQYLPDPVKDERINIGVIAFDADGVDCRFLHDWSRVRCFANRPVGFLQEITHEMQRACGAQRTMDRISDDRRITPSSIVEMSSKWSNSIQFTEPRGSLQGRVELVEDIAKRFLHETVRIEHPHFRTRTSAKSIVINNVQTVMDNFFSEETRNKFLKKNDPVEGLHETHKFDVSIKGDSGRPYFLVHGISLEGPMNEDREESLGAFKYAISDYLIKPDHAPFGVLVLPPKERLETYRSFTKTIRNMGATILSEETIDQVVERLIRNQIPAQYIDAPYSNTQSSISKAK